MPEISSDTRDRGDPAPKENVKITRDHPDKGPDSREKSMELSKENEDQKKPTSHFNKECLNFNSMAE